MNGLMILALICNLVLTGAQIYCLGSLKKKTDIFKYYTFLQNFLALLVSSAFSVYLLVFLLWGYPVPEFIRGLRYVATCGLAATTFIYAAFLAREEKNRLSQGDFLPGISPQRAKLLLHYLCPAISLLSFLVFERPIALESGIWTALAAIPSCGYWIVYLVLSAAKLWEEPYALPASEKKNSLVETLVTLLIPVSFIGISFLLWNLK